VWSRPVRAQTTQPPASRTVARAGHRYPRPLTHQASLHQDVGSHFNGGIGYVPTVMMEGGSAIDLLVVLLPGSCVGVPRNRLCVDGDPSPRGRDPASAICGTPPALPGSPALLDPSPATNPLRVVHARVPRYSSCARPRVCPRSNPAPAARRNSQANGLHRFCSLGSVSRLTRSETSEAISTPRTMGPGGRTSGLGPEQCRPAACVSRSRRCTPAGWARSRAPLGLARSSGHGALASRRRSRDSSPSPASRPGGRAQGVPAPPGSLRHPGRDAATWDSATRCEDLSPRWPTARPSKQSMVSSPQELPASIEVQERLGSGAVPTVAGLITRSWSPMAIGMGPGRGVRTMTASMPMASMVSTGPRQRLAFSLKTSGGERRDVGRESLAARLERHPGRSSLERQVWPRWPQADPSDWPR